MVKDLFESLPLELNTNSHKLSGRVVDAQNEFMTEHASATREHLSPRGKSFNTKWSPF